MSENNNLLKYIKVLDPSEIEVEQEDIYYREKYQEIIEYLKLLLTDSPELSIYKYFHPKGNLLINVQPGTDIIDYLKLISSNFYINCIQLKESTILDSSSDFFNNFIVLLNNLNNLTPKQGDDEEKEEEKNQEKGNTEENKKKLLIIDQKRSYNNEFSEKSLLNKFLTYYKEKENLSKHFGDDILLVWINYDYNEIVEYGDEVYEVFDLLISIPLINKVERKQILSEFMEKNPEISFNLESIVERTEGWEVEELRQLLKIAILKHYLKSELNTKSNEITDIIHQLIESGEYIPHHKKKELLEKKYSHTQRESIQEERQKTNNRPVRSNQESDSERESKTQINEIIKDIREKNYSEFMLQQLYENAASEHYNELVIIIDKLEKNEPLEPNDRKILSKYPFILNESKPSRAQIYLENAKKRIDLIKKSFGK